MIRPTECVLARARALESTASAEQIEPSDVVDTEAHLTLALTLCARVARADRPTDDEPDNSCRKALECVPKRVLRRQPLRRPPTSGPVRLGSARFGSNATSSHFALGRRCAGPRKLKNNLRATSTLRSVSVLCGDYILLRRCRVCGGRNWRRRCRRRRLSCGYWRRRRWLSDVAGRSGGAGAPPTPPSHIRTDADRPLGWPRNAAARTTCCTNFAAVHLLSARAQLGAHRSPRAPIWARAL